MTAITCSGEHTIPVVLGETDAVDPPDGYLCNDCGRPYIALVRAGQHKPGLPPTAAQVDDWHRANNRRREHPR